MLDWRDIFQSMATVLLSLGLFPSIFSRNKPSVATSMISAFGLGMIVLVLVSFQLWIAVAITSAEVVLWLWLGLQKIRMEAVEGSSE